MGDVIDLKVRRKGVDIVESPDLGGPIMDITDLRQEQIQADRRDAKRTILNGFVGASVVVPGRGLLKVGIFDISRGGLSFDLNAESGHFSEGEELAMRFYFNHNVYFPFVVRVTSFRVKIDEGVSRHGTTFVFDQTNSPVINHFVDFIEAVISELKTDKGDLFINEFGG